MDRVSFGGVIAQVPGGDVAFFRGVAGVVWARAAAGQVLADSE